MTRHRSRAAAAAGRPPSPRLAPLLVLALACALPCQQRAPAAPALAAEAARTIAVRDTLASEADGDPRAQALLLAIAWERTEFEVTVAPRAPGEPGDHAALVTFPSAKPSGEAAVDRVVCEWFRPRHSAPGAPAVLLVHILDGRLVLERAVARALAVQGVHAFVLQLPGYQSRRTNGGRPGLRDALRFGRQGIADARRARDAIAALPGVLPDRVSLMGISLGSILGASAAALDGAFADVFLFLGGGDLRSVFRDGRLEVERLRDGALRSGMTLDEIDTALDGVDPLPLAHRLPRERTWLWSAESDPVMPPRNARLLAEAAGLAEEHHLWFAGTHHSGVVRLPEFVGQVAARVLRGTAPQMVR